jgi:hypothetical protein
MSTAPALERPWAEDPALTLELRTLLACARAVVDPRHLAEFRANLAACRDAELLCGTAVAQGMLGHLHRLATAGPDMAQTAPGVTPESPGVDPVLVSRLTELQRLSAHRSLRQTGHLLRLLERLRAAGVQAMPYKGPAWAERLYGDVALRSWADLDLLVAYDQVASARETLLANGFVDSSSFNARILARERGGWGEVAFTAVDQDVHVELHWEITAGFSGRSLRPESLFARAGHLSLLGRDVVSVSAVDCLVMTCVNGTKDRWDKVEGLLGLAVQVPAMTSAMWQDAAATARKAGCTRRVTISVAHACRVFGLQTPPEVAEALGRDFVARALLRSVTPDSLNRGSLKGSRRELAMKSWRFATEDSVTVGIWHGAVRFFRPGPEDWDWIALPSWAEWLYRALRPARLAVKWAKRL